MRIVTILAICTLFLLSCSKRGENEPAGANLLSHATLLRIEQTDSFTLATIDNPWKAGDRLATYVLIPADAALPATRPEGTLLRTPLRRAIAFSTVHAALLGQLGVEEHLLGICDARFAVGDSLKHAVASGRLTDFGPAAQPSIEAIIAACPDGLLVSPMENAGYGLVEKLGTPLIICADYMETSALGRAEWMRFFGLLFNCREEADALFKEIETDYAALRHTAASASTRPAVLYDMKEGSAWHVPGGRSTWAELFKDAGISYAFADNGASGSVTPSFETVFSRCGEADFWMLKYGRSSDITYKSLADDFPPYRRLRPWRERRAYGCNTFRTPFYEDAPFRPDRLLHDVIKMAHPELLKESPFFYYEPLL